MNDRQIQDRRYQALSTEIGGQKIYECAVTCAQDAGLRARELWIDSLGVPNVLRPPEEEKVTTTIEAAPASGSFEEMLDA